MYFRFRNINIHVFTDTHITSASNETLYCHKCEEQFKQWDPYTECQIYANATPLVQCLPEEQYCLVRLVVLARLKNSK